MRDCYINVTQYLTFAIIITKIDFLIVTHFHCYVTNDSLCLFAANVFSTSEIFAQDKKANHVTKNFQKMQKF